MRRHLLGAPIIKALQGVKAGTGGGLPFMGLETRPTEALFVKPGNDRCTIVFALNFPDETDNAIARVMLQQFAKESSKVRAWCCGRISLSFKHFLLFLDHFPTFPLSRTLSRTSNLRICALLSSPHLIVILNLSF